MVWCRTPEYYESRPWRGEKSRSGGGVLINQAIHTIDLVQWLLGEVEQVAGRSSRTSPPPGLGKDIEDTAHLVLHHRGGARSVLFATVAGAVDFPVTLEITTAHATLTIRNGLTVTWSDGRRETAEDRSSGPNGRSHWGQLPSKAHRGLLSNSRRSSTVLDRSSGGNGLTPHPKDDHLRGDAMWTLSGFIDEISADPDEQVRIASDLGLRYAEVRSAWDTNILDLTDGQLEELRDVLTEADMAVSCIGSPIGKIFVDEDLDVHLVRMKHAAHVATLFEAPYIRIFSFWLRPGSDPAGHRDEVLLRMRAMADVAEKAGVTLLHENERGIYGDVPQRCLDIVESVGSPNLQLAWDPANFVQAGVHPYTDGYAILRPHLKYVQIKDARFCDGTVVPSGQGDGEIAQTIRALHEDGFDGFFSLEPHLAECGASGGFSGAYLFTQACAAFRSVLDTQGIPFQ